MQARGTVSHKDQSSYSGNMLLFIDRFYVASLIAPRSLGTQL